MSIEPSLVLNDGRSMPRIGFGVWQIPPGEVERAVRLALDAGYRSIDTAAIYNNEEGVGDALAGRADRSEVFVTTKLWNDRQGFDETLRAFDESLKRLRLETIDLYLIHWPVPRKNLYRDSWRALVRLKQEGRAKSIGVSNFTIATLEHIIADTGVVPVVNQVELHPRFQQKELRAFHRKHAIATESWSPLGRGRLFRDQTIAELARKHGRTAAQIVLRWHLDNGLIVIPKSVTPSRIRENIDLFDFRLDEEDMARIDRLDDQNGRVGPDPDAAAF
jgi:2,5-diketo-D-gluconate reductase A